MIDTQTTAAIIFVVFLAIFVFLKRKSLDTKQIIPYFLYFSMYRTKIGLGMMDFFAQKYRKLVVYIGYFGIFVGFLGMILISYGLINNIYVLFTKPTATPGVGLVLPFKGKGIFYVPFFYWIISIFFILVVHEFAHGFMAMAHNVKVKSSGLAFFGIVIPIIPGAFVEVDEKNLKKRPSKQDLSVSAAGPLSNIAFAFLFVAIASFILAPLASATIEPNGVKVTDYVEGKDKSTFPAETAGLKIGEVIQNADGKNVPYVENLSAVLKSKKPNDVVKIKTDKSSYEVRLAKNPDNESLAYMGAYLEQSTKIKDGVEARYGKFIPNALIWVYGLAFWLYFLNFGIGLFNLVPLGPLDGGRMMQVALRKIFDKERGDKYWTYIGIFFLILILTNIAAGFVR